MLPSNYSRRVIKTEQDEFNTKSYKQSTLIHEIDTFGVMTRKGERKFGESGNKTFIAREKRFHTTFE
jgi:hypothetical protein